MSVEDLTRIGIDRCFTYAQRTTQRLSVHDETNKSFDFA